MRVIEPHQLRKSKPKRTKKQTRALVGLALLMGVFVGVIALMTTNHGVSLSGVLGKSDTEKKQDVGHEEYRYFAPPEFQQLYGQFVYPNTQMPTSLPKITNSAAADARIRTIASSRGFVMRSIPVAPIMKIDDIDKEDGLLQEKAAAAWTDLKDAAQHDNIPLTFGSGYRTIEMQRQIFLKVLSEEKATTAQIAAGKADAQVVAALKRAAIPGYSRHSTGYTIDLMCGDSKLPFQYTACYKWLSKDNYLNAKKAGWIPSYPEGVSDNSPEPEPWEYVWVGKQAVLKE